jgi:hypothetical protein
MTCTASPTRNDRGRRLGRTLVLPAASLPARLAELLGVVGLLAAAPLAGAGLSFPVVDTGQILCYDASVVIPCPAAGQAFHGQDAQNAGNAPAFTRSPDFLTIRDAVTGLTWQRSPDTNGDGMVTQADKLTLAQALARPAALNAAKFAGYSDWRLPTVKELYSLVDFRGTDPSGLSGPDTSRLTPFIDTSYFRFAYGSAPERIIDSQYASSTLYVAGSAGVGSPKLFGVNFADGRIKGYDLSMPGGSTKTFFVQCVRGTATYGVNRFTDNGDGSITDSASGLMWSRDDSGAAMTWQEALAWADSRNAANFLGHADWRLPDAKELQGLVDYSRSPDTTSSAAIDPHFVATPITNEGGMDDFPWYWASTTHASPNGMGASGVYVCFGRCGGWQLSAPPTSCYIWTDVHGAGAQRSDPKTPAGRVHMGTACNGETAWGLGPQGDVQRGANFVRLVRNASTEGCASDPESLCLLGGRFRVTASYLDYAGGTGTGRAAALSADTGYFWFFDAANVEVVAKMVSFCGSGGNVAVYANGLTDLGVTLRVTDTFTGQFRDYSNPRGTDFSLVRDGPFTCLGSLAAGPEPAASLARGTTKIEGSASAGTEAVCNPDGTTLCLLGGRFQVTADYVDYSDRTGNGQAVALTADTGYFWFFDSANVEVVAKMVPFCGTGGNVAVYANGLTDLGVHIRVTDTLDGTTRVYSNVRGHGFSLLRDGPFRCQ